MFMEVFQGILRHCESGLFFPGLKALNSGWINDDLGQESFTFCCATIVEVLSKEITR